MLTRHELAAVKTRSILRMGRRHLCLVTAWASNDQYSSGSLQGPSEPRRGVNPHSHTSPAGFSHTLQHSRDNRGDRLGVVHPFHKSLTSLEAQR